jgi:hypothetical protein
MLNVTKGTQAFRRLLPKTWHRNGLHAPTVTSRMHPAFKVRTPILKSAQSASSVWTVRIGVLESECMIPIAIGSRVRLIIRHSDLATFIPCVGNRLRRIQMLKS